jgi:hypothetical protein
MNLTAGVAQRGIEGVVTRLVSDSTLRRRPALF